MVQVNTLDKFIRIFAFRDALYRSVSLIGGTFTIAAISLLPGFGVKGLLIATSIQLLLSAILELPTSVIADKYGRSLVLRVSLFLKLFVSLALGFAIYFASNGNNQWVWYAFFVEAFLDAISNTLISGAYQVSYLSLYDSLPAVDGESKPPLFLSSFRYGIKFRILFPVGFTLLLISVFRLSSQYHQSLYFGAYLILALILSARIALFLLINSDFKNLPSELDKAKIGIRTGLKQVISGISRQKTIFATYSITCLLAFLGTLYLSGQSMKLLPLMGLPLDIVWIAAIGTSIIIYLLRTLANILILPKLTKERLQLLTPIFGFLIILSGIVLIGVDTYFSSIVSKYLVFILITAVVFVAFDAIAKSIESSLKEILKSEYKATWLSLGNTSAYLVFGVLSVVMSNVHIDKSNLIVGALLAICGLFILMSQLLYRANSEATSFLDVLRFQLIKVLLFIVGLVVVIDSVSYSIVVQNKIREIRTKTSETVLLGIKSSILQGNIIDASNFLYSLKSGNFISCFDLNVLKTNINDCKLNAIDFKNSDSELVDISFDGNQYGNVTLHFDLNPLRRDIYVRVISDIVFSLFLYIGLFYVFQLIAKVISKEVNYLHDSLEKTDVDIVTEFRISEFKEIYLRLIESIRLRESLQFQSAIVNVASQVSHDIRSPLSALNLMTTQLTQIPEDKRIIIRSAVNRINDIANQLLQKSKSIVNRDSGLQLNNSTARSKNVEVELLSPLIDSIVSEKRIQFREKQKVDIEAEINHSYGVFAKIDAIEIKRTISNLINNAVEALPDEAGKVLVSVKQNGSTALIIVQDNGKGMPEHILKKIGEIGVSYGKEGSESGSGLGIYHAKKSVEDVGGQFQIQSIEGKGTAVTMTFNKTAAPSWFVEKLVLKPESTVISLDDDISIHQIWKGRFESNNIAGVGIAHRTFTSGSDFKTWVVSQVTTVYSKSVCLYLVDYELLSQSFSGLDLIEELNIGAQSILVTSRYEENHIRVRCEKLGVRLIPKAMAGFVPIEIEKQKQIIDGILLDDDSLVHSCWQIVADSKNKKFVGFYKPSDFFDRAAEFHPDSKIFVDSNLGNGIKGEGVSQRIHELGFKNIYICTGYQASDFPAMHWIKDIVGKDPQF